MAVAVTVEELDVALRLRQLLSWLRLSAAVLKALIWELTDW